MEPKIEINRLSIELDQTMLTDLDQFSDHTSFHWDGTLPVINAPVRLRLENLQWLTGNDNSTPESFSAAVTALVADPDWSVMADAKIHIATEWNQGICRWGMESCLNIPEIRLDKESQFLIDGNPVLLTPSINRILSGKDSLQIFSQTKVDAIIRKISQQKFGSDVLIRLMKDRFYKVSPMTEHDRLTMVASLSEERSHFEQSEVVSPYLFVGLPTIDIVYFIRHSIRPEEVIKGYKLLVSNIDVTGINRLIINLKETYKELDFLLDIELTVSDNMIYPIVNSIKAVGLNPLKKVVFNLFRSVLIRQIENRPLDFGKIYMQSIRKFSARYPFLTIQDNRPAVLDKLSIDPEMTEVLIHYPENRRIHHTIEE